MGDYWTLDQERIRKITQLSVQFRAQDRLECRGRVDIEWGPNYWAELTAERDYEGNIHYQIREN